MESNMATQKQVKKGSEQSSDLEQKVQELRELYADASEIGKTALENVIRALKSGTPAKETTARIESAGRIGRRQGKVSELTVIVPLAPGGAKRLRGFLEALHGSIGNELVDMLDLQFGDTEGWPGVRSPKIKDHIASHQITADFWYVANPNLTVVETRRLERIGNAMEEFLDKIS